VPAIRPRARGSRPTYAAGSGPAAPPAAGTCPRTRSGSASRARGTAGRVAPLFPNRVLRRDTEKRRAEPPRLALCRHLALLHRLEERRLRLRRGAVDLVGEKEGRGNSAGPELHIGLALVEDRRAGHV